MERIFSFDIGSTSIGFTVIDYCAGTAMGTILKMGVRIFPEARDPKGTPHNQQRRAKRMVRRQLRRRKDRRRTIAELLQSLSLLPAFSKDPDSEWADCMAEDPYLLRLQGLSTPLSPFQVGRAFYHLSKHRHFRGREALEDSDSEETAADELEAAGQREELTATLKQKNLTLGAYLAQIAYPQRRRGHHATRAVVEAEFEALWQEQSRHYPALRQTGVRDGLFQAIFFQRPVFWRTNTLGACPLHPSAPLAARGSWLYQQWRMLDRLNVLAITGGNQRPLDPEERAIILKSLQTQNTMTWGGLRRTLKPLYAARGEAGAEKSLKFNLEQSSDKGIHGNAVEAQLARIFGAGWADHPQQEAIRDATEDLRQTDYATTPDNRRILILSPKERLHRRTVTATALQLRFGLSDAQRDALRDMSFPPEWAPYSGFALRAMLPELERGAGVGSLLNSPEWADWRNATFPERDQPTGEIHDTLPSPADPEEARRLAGIRNPTVIRVLNELRKVANNLIHVYGKPDRIRIEVTREVGKSKRERDEDDARIKKQEKRRAEADKDLKAKGIAAPTHDQIEKWLLWKECNQFDPYSGLPIGFDDLFGDHPRYEVEHIWPRSRCFDNGFGNKTLCHRDYNRDKGNRTPFEAFGHTDHWAAMKGRMWGHVEAKRMSKGKFTRFVRSDALDEDFTSRQLIDTSHAARQAVTLLKKLWPDAGPTAPVRVETVNGRITAQMRRLWKLNSLLADDGEKNRADHRHHAVDALVVGCIGAGTVQTLSRYWQQKETGAPHPDLPPPWPEIRNDARSACADIVVSHRVRRKVSGSLHKETIYGDTGVNETTKSGTYRLFVTRKKVEALSKSELAGDAIRDPHIRSLLQEWVADHGGDPKKAFATYPRLEADGPEVRKVRLLVKQQVSLMAEVSTGYADLDGNHHIAIYRAADGKTVFEVVSLLEASRRLSRRVPVINTSRDDGSVFIMSLCPGDALLFEREGKQEIRIVQGVWASGVVVTKLHTDAKQDSIWRPSAGSILSSGTQKVLIDPIGRIRPSND